MRAAWQVSIALSAGLSHCSTSGILPATSKLDARWEMRPMSDSQPQQRKLDGNTDYQSALDTLFAQPGTTLRIFDRSLSDGYNTQRRHDALRAFLLAKRTARIKIVLHDTSDFVRDCPRMVSLVRDFSHAIE